MMRRLARACPSPRLLSTAVLTVLALGLLLATSAAPASALSFAPALRFPMLGGPMAIVTADLNGDANPDVATANFDRRRVGVLLGDGRGGFSAATYYAADSNVTDIVVNDFNGDGHEDIATASEQGTVSLLLGDGTGAFAPGAKATARGFSLAVGDLDGDGHQDIVTGGSVLLGDGLGGFAPAIDIPGPWGECVVADLNGDGKLDAAKIIPLFGWAHSYLEILVGDGAGRLVPSSLYRTRREPVGIAVGDLNADGRQDLVIGEDATNTLSEATAPGGFEVFIGDGDGTFTTGSMRATSEAVYQVVLADLDGDGRQDVVSNQMRRPNVVVARGDGHGSLRPALSFPAGAVPSDVAVADFNRDGMPDLAASARTSVRVLLSRPRAARPFLVVPAK
jgi:hypothetical protein